LERDNFMSAEEAVLFGLIDEVVPERKLPSGRRGKPDSKDDKDKEKKPRGGKGSSS
jgi:hypothetical protein